MFLSGRGNPRLHQCLVLLALGTVWVSAAPTLASGSCKTRVIRDYTAFLNNLPPLPSPPVDEHLPFAPERVFFSSQGGGPLQPGAGLRYYSLSYSPGGSDPGPVLDWQVTTTLTPIDDVGRPSGPPRIAEQHVDRLWPVEEAGANVLRFGFDVPGDPATYRLEIRIAGADGQQLAAFGEYFRVLQPSADLRISLNRKTFKPKQHLQATLSNYGVAWYGYGFPWWVEYKRGGSWKPSPVDFTPGAFLMPLLSLRPGESTSCWGGEVPSDTPPGRYRFVTDIFGSDRQRPLRANRLIYAPFTVLPRRDFVTNTAVGRRTTRRES